MAEITKSQIRAAHVALSRHGIDDDTYRALLDNEFGVKSCKELDRAQAHKLIMKLNGGRAKPRKRRPIKNPAQPVPQHQDSVVYLATPAQCQLIYDLQQEISWDHTDGYQRWLKTCLGLDKVRDRDEASRVIQGLKGLKRGGHARATG